MHGFFPDDDQLNAEFFAAKNVQFSVDLLCKFGAEGGADQRLNPSFLVWVEATAIYMTDLDDGFSPALARSIGQAVELLVAAGMPVDEKPLYWRDAHKVWHRLGVGEWRFASQAALSLV